MYDTENQVTQALKKAILDPEMLRSEIIDKLVYTSVFSEHEQIKIQSRQAIRKLAASQNIYSASIQKLYEAFGKEQISGFTVPAMNLKMLTYDTSRLIFQIAIEKNIGGFIFEIAPTEMDYTNQKPDEFATSVLAGAIKEGYKGPIFIQGDHYQVNPKRYLENVEKEIQRIETLIQESVDAQFYNIDIDASTVVDLHQKDPSSQQKANYEITASLTKTIRGAQPKNIEISIGGEIGHIGGINSTTEDFEAFMKGYGNLVQNNGMSKVSVQTGTSHGGTPLSDGSVANVALDFSVLSKIGNIARKEYGIGGAVQHGASTLPIDLFDKFVTAKTLEIHLATGFQNTIYDTMPTELKATIYDWLKKNLRDEWKNDWSEQQFLYKLRKKAAGPFKKTLWHLSETEKEPIRKALKTQLLLIFEKLHVFDTRTIVEKYIPKNSQ